MHEIAEKTYQKMQLFKELSEYDSRLLELINYCGWEVGHKAHFCRAFYFEDSPEYTEARKKLGVSDIEYRIMHQYAAWHRFSPEREDMFYIFDYIINEVASKSSNPVSVVDFGCGLGQIGLAFSMNGMRTYFVDIVEEYLKFSKYLCDSRKVKVHNEYIKANSKYFFSTENIKNLRVIIEWSSFEHIENPLEQLKKLTEGLEKGGMMITTSLKKDWTDELVEHYKKDGGVEIVDKLNSQDINEYIDQNFTVRSPKKTIAKILIRK